MNIDSEQLIKRNCFFQFFPSSPNPDLLDYGTLGMGEKRDLYFTIINKNPVPVTLRGWGSNLTGSLVELMGVAQGNETNILQRANFSGKKNVFNISCVLFSSSFASCVSFLDMTRMLNINPGHYMVFRIGIMTKDVEGETNGTVFVDTDYHHFKVAFRFTVARGSLHTVPRELNFDPVFPVST